MNQTIRMRVFPAAVAAAMLAGCASSPVPDQGNEAAVGPAKETMLLVSLDDGTIIRQTVDLDADVCIKSVTETTTTCLVQGEPVLNESGTVVGYEMLSNVIDLYDAE